MNLKEKFINKLDLYMKSNLAIQKKIDKSYSEFRDERQEKLSYEMMSRAKLCLEIILLFSNDTIGRVETNRLCRKHEINNYTGGLPL